MKKILILLCLILLPYFYQKGAGFDYDPVSFSHPGGFYQEPFDLRIETGRGVKEVYYTLDGSPPTPGGESSFLYMEPIHLKDPSQNPNRFNDHSNISDWFDDEAPNFTVDKSNIVRAAAFGADGKLMDEVCATYFVGLDGDKYESITVLSLIADPEDLFGYEKGIYVFGKSLEEAKEPGFKPQMRPVYDLELPLFPANFLKKGREWERPCNIEFYFPGEEKDFSGKMGVRIKGGYSRHYAQKGLSLFARNDYGSPYIEHDFWNGNSEGSIREDSLALSAGGFSDRVLKFKDGFLYDLSRDLDLTAPAWRPAVLFLNGEYWGFYQLAQRVNEDFFWHRYSIPKDNVAILKLYNKTEEQRYYPLYEELLDLACDNDISDPDIYAQVCEMVDIQSMYDYYGVNMYVYNTDWPHKNVVLWRSISKGGADYEDCRWRYVLGDLNIDNCTDAYYVEEDMLDQVLEDDPLFARLFENEEFRAGFCDNMLKLSQYTFDPQAVHERLYSYGEKLKRYVEDDIERFPNYTVSGWSFSDRLEEMDTFFKKRPAAMEKIIKKWMLQTQKSSR